MMIIIMYAFRERIQEVWRRKNSSMFPLVGNGMVMGLSNVLK